MAIAARDFLRSICRRSALCLQCASLCNGDISSPFDTFSGTPQVEMDRDLRGSVRRHPLLCRLVYGANCGDRVYALLEDGSALGFVDSALLPHILLSLDDTGDQSYERTASPVPCIRNLP